MFVRGDVHWPDTIRTWQPCATGGAARYCNNSMTFGLTIRKPTAEDGVAAHRLIADCPPLDANSLYCNLLQCTHFADSCAVAEVEGAFIGFLSGYRLPHASDILFVWQVAVGDAARGTGVAGQMLQHILRRPENVGVGYIHTTITRANASSWAFFRKFAKSLDAQYAEEKYFDQDVHLAGGHASEFLLKIGPFEPVAAV